MSARTPSFEAVLASQRALRLMYTGDEFDEDTSRFDSPIERVFLGQMLSHHWWVSAHYGATDTFERVHHIGKEAGLECWEGPQDLVLYYVQRYHRPEHFPVAITQPSMRLGEKLIRPDYAFILPGSHATKIVVELDGHDFHERTPEQAQSDKSRDRALQALGWHVLRFTGREVLRDPERCLHEVESLLIAKAVLARQKEKEAEL